MKRNLHQSGGFPINQEQMWICVKCRFVYKAEKAHQKCPKCGANEDMQGKLPEATLFEMIEEWKCEEH
ncbi:MAG: hypothetical protein QXJ68_02715 [Methanocellales archaeon]